MNYISGNFVVWAWDMTHDTNRTRFVPQQGTFNFQNSIGETRAVLAHFCWGTRKFSDFIIQSNNNTRLPKVVTSASGLFRCRRPKFALN